MTSIKNILVAASRADSHPGRHDARYWVEMVGIPGQNSPYREDRCRRNLLFSVGGTFNTRAHRGQPMKSAPNFQRFLAVGYAVFFALVAVSQSQAAAADKRIALVIGNSAYQNTERLPNPKNDANDMAARLTSLGFRVILGQDLEKSAMDKKIGEFAEALRGADVAVFFYGGHGLQVGGQNYLVPVDAKLKSTSSLDFEAVRLELVQHAMEIEAKTNIIFLDACRDNPLARSLARSMGTRELGIPSRSGGRRAKIGTLVSFSTQPGNVALDGEDGNSPYAAALVRHLEDSNSLSNILIQVRNDVAAATQQQQVPWEHSALRANVYFSTPKSAPSQHPATETATRSGLSFNQLAELDLWRSIDKTNPALLESFRGEISKRPLCRYSAPHD